MAKFFLTGAAGFIASKVAQFLLDSGDSVVAVDNLNDYYDVGLKRHRLKSLEGKSGFEFYEQDIESLPGLSKIFEEHEFDGVINLAARAGVRYSMENPFVYMTTNANASLNLLELMRKHEIKKYVLASTSSLYAGQEMPFVETLSVNTPISPYAASKKAAEVMAYSYHYLFKIDVSVVRYFTVFGPAGRPDMSVFRFISQIDQGETMTVYGDGSQSRDFTFVDDIARGTIAAIKPVGYEIMNLGGGKRPVSLSYIIELIEQGLGKKARIDYRDFHSADMKSTWADISKAKELLDWEPEISVENGIQKTVQWYKDNLPWSAEIKLTD